MRTHSLLLLSFLLASLIGLSACGDEGGGDSSCLSETVAGLSAHSSKLETSDLCVTIDGVASFQKTKSCMGGYYLRDSSAATDFIYLYGFEPDTSDFPEDSTLFHKVRVEADFRPNEDLCDSLLCHCQRKLYVRSVKRR